VEYIGDFDGLMKTFITLFDAGEYTAVAQNFGKRMPKWNPPVARRGVAAMIDPKQGRG